MIEINFYLKSVSLCFFLNLKVNLHSLLSFFRFAANMMNNANMRIAIGMR